MLSASNQTCSHLIPEGVECYHENLEDIPIDFKIGDYLIRVTENDLIEVWRINERSTAKDTGTARRLLQ